VGTPRPDLAALRGARFVASVETAANRRLAAPIVKELTGGDTITARHLYAEQFSFVPTCKLWLAANDAPNMSDRDSGLWRRLRRVPFEHVIKKPDPTIKARLRDPQADGRALFAWAVQGCIAWQRDRLGTCELVASKSAELRASFDPLAEFFAKWCVFDADKMVSARALREAYDTWQGSTNAREGINNKELGERLQKRGCESDRSMVAGKRVRVWKGIGLLPADGDALPPVDDKTPAQADGTDGTDTGHFYKSSLVRGTAGTIVKQAGVCPVCPPGATLAEQQPIYVDYVAWCAAEGKEPLDMQEWRQLEGAR